MFQNQYETVFILTPVLSEAQIKEAVEKFKKTLTDNGAELVHEEHWGLRKLAYTIQHKNTGYYQLFQYKANTSIVATLETDFKRDERVMRYLTTKLDKYALDYSQRRSKGLIGKKNVESAPADSKEEKAEATTQE
ncbi:30S ribosomal protein S6 [Emticicia soli]|uniref:Small ribosomal subunit protein bS6 n=1 Tax=Emticicia soli TaxID=2027878 RepID=A0ABW5JCJ4_9BACT